MARRIALNRGHPDPDGARYCLAPADACAKGAVAAGQEVRRIAAADLDVGFVRNQAEANRPAPLRHVRDSVWRTRPARPTDVPRPPEIERDAAQFYRSIGYDLCADGSVSDQDAHLRGLDTGALFVAEVEDERIVGFVLLWRVDGCTHAAEISVARAGQGLKPCSLAPNRSPVPVALTACCGRQ